MTITSTVASPRARARRTLGGALAAPLRALADEALMRRDGLSGWRRHRRAFRQCSAWSAEQIERYSLERLRAILDHAFRTVPFYRERWSAAEFMPSRCTSVHDLRRLPLLLKDDLRRRRAELISTAVAPTALHVDYTGGTTGTQTTFHRDHACRVARVGRQRGVLERCGYRPGEKRAVIWGAHGDLLPSGARGLKQRLREFASSDAALNCTVVRPADLLGYHRKLQTFRPAVLYGYPNAIEEFARFIRAENLPPIRIARVFCTAEALCERQRLLFQEVFGGEVFNLYCSREHGCVGFECEAHEGLHIDAGSVFLEVLRNGRQAAPGESGNVVITDLLNHGMPLIRYVTGDVATVSKAPCPCGCALPTIARLEGRVSDLIYSPDGTVIAGLMLDDLFIDVPAITHAQFVQNDIYSLDVRLVPRSDAHITPDLRARLLTEVRSLVGHALDVRLQFVDEIPRHPQSGKYQNVVSRVAEHVQRRLGSATTAGTEAS